jgi:hypothetical protein
MTNLAPSATVTFPVKVWVPDHVSVPTTMPALVSLFAETVGTVTIPTIKDSKRMVTRERLLKDRDFDMVFTMPALPRPDITLWGFLRV